MFIILTHFSYFVNRERKQKHGFCVENPNLEENPYFKPIASTSVSNLFKLIDDFEGWVENYKNGEGDNELTLNYDFDSSVISNDDFLYIDGKYDGGVWWSYDVYFFDYETNTLYYFHNNI